MKMYEVEIEGTTPLLQHRMTEEALFGLLGAKGGPKKLKEELTPREIAEKHSYKNDNGEYYIPAEMISGAFRNVASDYKQKNSTRKSYKAIAGGVFRPITGCINLLTEEDETIKSFEVDVRKATNHGAGAVVVCRPRFDRWKLKFEVALDNTMIEPEVALQILEDSGRRAGLGSFRVSKGGYFGQFQVVTWKEKKKK